MTIEKMSSKDFNILLEEAKENIDKVNNEVKFIKKDMLKKITITKYENEYLNYCLQNLVYNNNNYSSYLMLNNNFDGLYTEYSNMIHPCFKSKPVNLFNLTSINSNSEYFRDELIVSINDIEKDEYKNILKSDNIEDKDLFFTEIPVEKTIENNVTKYNDSLKISIEINKDKIIGVSKFNIIEIDPFLYKSFDIEKIEIYDNDINSPTITITPILKANKSRIILNEKYIFRKVIFYLKLRYKTTSFDVDTEVFPFGLKHIYFLDADFRNDSYVIVQYNSNDYIDFVKNEIYKITPFGENKTSIKEEGITIFTSYENKVLEDEVFPTENIKRSIAKNVKSLYFKIPLNINSKYNNSLIAYKMFIENR